MVLHIAVELKDIMVVFAHDQEYLSLIVLAVDLDELQALFQSLLLFWKFFTMLLDSKPFFPLQNKMNMNNDQEQSSNSPYKDERRQPRDRTNISKAG